MKKPKKVVKPWVRVTFTVIESVLIVAICASLVFLGLSFYLDKKSENRMEELRSQVKASRLQLEQIQPDKDKKQSLSMMLLGKEDSGENQDEEAQINAVSGDGIEKALSESKVGKPKEHQDKPILDIYKELHNQNENFAGWLYVDGTQLEYPIMQGPDNKFYLSHGMDRTYDKYGMLIMDVNCTPDIEGGHLIIYGHNVNDGKLFGNLLFFKDSGYIDYHPDISFDTLYEHGNYKVFAVVTTTVTQAQQDAQLFSTYNFDSRETFDKIVKWAKDNSMYEIGYTPEYGDEILTLVTCEHSSDEGRFIVLSAK